MLGALLLVGWRAKSGTESAYLFADRKMGWVALTATLVMTEFNSATLISFSSMGYGMGLQALVFPLIFLVGLLFYAVTVAKKWKTFDGLSVAGFFTERYGHGLGRLTSALLLLAMAGFSATYVKSLTMLFAPVLGLNGWVVSALLMSVVLLMCLRGGLVAIMRTDLLSMGFMLLFFPFIAFVMWKTSGYSTTVFEIAVPGRFVVSLIALTMFTYILAPWYGQKIFAARSTKTALWSVVLAALLVFGLYGCAIVATACFRMRGGDLPWEEALPTLINTCLPRGVRGCGYALLFATSATTLTGVWSAMSTMWIGDFLKTASTSSKRSVWITVGFALLSYLLSNTLVDKVFDKLILANIPVAALSFGLLAGFYWKRATAFGVYVSVIVGCAWGVGTYLYYGESGGYTWYWALYGIPLIFTTGILASIVARPLQTSTSKSRSLPPSSNA